MASQQQRAAFLQRVQGLAGQQKFSEAANLLSTYLQAEPADLESQWVYCQLLEKAQRFEEALDAYLALAKHQTPVTVVSLERALNLAVCFGFPQKGIGAGERLTQANLATANSWYQLGCLYSEINFLLSAKKCLVQAIDMCAVDEERAVYIQAYARACLNAGDFTEGRAKLRSLIDAGTADSLTYTLNCAATNYQNDISNDEIFEEHKRYAEFVEARCTESPSHQIDAGRKLRIGFLSADFYSHSVAIFLKPLLENYDRSNWEVVCFSDVANEDSVTEEIKALVDHWHVCRPLNDNQVYDLVVASEVDVLIDLVGYFGESRAAVFARRAAPVQVTYLGYPNTTGLTAMDYRITDTVADPIGMTERYHSETLARLSGCFLCYQPKIDAPGIAPLPMLAASPTAVTFGSTNVLRKITDSMLDVWIAILKSVPKSRLIIKAQQLAEPEMAERLLSRMNEALGEKGRIEVLGWLPKRVHHLAFFERIDIHLDTYPYTGTTTTFEALWQGVPSVTMAGNNHCSRVGCSIMSAVSLEDWVANSIDEYIHIAVEKSKDPDALMEVRQKMRKQITSAGLIDGAAFAIKFQEAIHSMVEKVQNIESAEGA